MTGMPTPGLTPKTPSKEAFRDVTEEYLHTAIPNSHTVQDLHTYVAGGTAYTVDGHNILFDYSDHEKEIAELLERELGGEIFMLPRINFPQGISTPDYLFRGEACDLKTIEKDAGPNAIWNRIKKAKRQAHRFIVDVTKAKQLSDGVIDGQIEKIFRDRATLFVNEIILVRNHKIVKILKRI